MTYVDLLLQNAQYLNDYNELQELEADRLYCRHNMEHFMDVARIAYILSIEKDLQINKEVIYLTALLHDLGRVEEYKTGISHDKASVALAGEILLHIECPEKMIMIIEEAISQHRRRQSIADIDGTIGKDTSLGDLIAIADQLSRKCFLCEEVSSCKWHQEEKVMKIVR